MELRGLPGAPGCEIGNVVIYRPQEPITDKLPAEDAEAEIKALDEARARYDKTLAALEEKAGDEGGIFAAYREVLSDDVFFDDIKEIISSESVCSSYAIDRKRAETEAIFLEIDDDYLRERAADINNVCRELMAEIQGISTLDPFAGADGDSLIIFADDLTPADTVRMDPARLKGMVTARGGVTSHTVILAKARRIPAIVGAGDVFSGITDGDTVLIDGANGLAVVDPDEATMAEFVKVKAEADKKQELYDSYKGRSVSTEDGVPVRVNINSGDRESIDNFDYDACDGCGLFRTEFVYMGCSDYPDEEAQYKAYREMADKTLDKELIIRTLDIGGDKQLGYMNIPAETNPFLGYRAIRLCLDRKEVFKTQLRAILRASADRNIKIMLPMIVTLEEVKESKALLKEAMAELKSEGIPFNENIPVGIMVETPAAVLMSDVLAGEVDFFSVGSNDLIQYVTASDRQNENVQYVYNSFNISFLRALNLAAENARKAGIEIGICGETASEPSLIPLWVAMGIDELSVAPGLVGRTKYYVSRMNKAKLQSLKDKVLASSAIEDAKAILQSAIAEI